MTSYKTRTGLILTDADIHALAEEVEIGHYDIDTLKKRSRRPPAMGSMSKAVQSTESASVEQSRV